MSFPVLFDIVRKRPPFVLVKDEFTTAQAAPLTTPGPADPGPGVRTVVQPQNALSISGGNLVISSSGVGSGNDTHFSHEVFSLVEGIGYFIKIAGISSGTIHFGILDGTGVLTPRIETTMNTLSSVRPFQGASAVTNVVPVPAVGPFVLWYVRRLGGGVYIGIDTTLCWVESHHADVRALRGQATRAAITNAGTIDWMKVVNLGKYYSAWAGENGLAHQLITGVLPNGQTFTHPSDFLLDVVITTLPSAGSASDVKFRIQDANNYMRLRVGPAPTNTISVDKIEAGVATAVATGGNAVTGMVVRVLLEGTTVRIWRALSGTPAIGGSGTTAVFAGSTNGLIEPGDGSLSDLYVWPRTLTGVALDGYNAVISA